MAIQLSSRFLSLVVHDLRTPLNVIGLTLRLIDQAMPKRGPDLDEDLRVVHENVAQIERMLGHLTDYSRLIDDSAAPRSVPFDPRRMASELVEDRASRAASAPLPTIALQVRPDCPPEVELDPAWCRLALQHALNNALGAAEGSRVVVELGGSPGRLQIEVRVDRPPPSLLKPTPLHSDRYERLFGSTHERRGLDLAIAARVSELLGGSARLEVNDGQSSSVVLDWPARLEGHASRS